MGKKKFISFNNAAPINTARRFRKNILHAVQGIPAAVLACILLTRRCTQRCRQCAIPQNPGEPHTIDFNDFQRVIDSLDRYGSHIVTLSGGEPLLHPQFEACIRYAAQKGFMHVQVLSSLYVKEEIVERAADALIENGAGIQVSFDGFGEVADRIRGAKNVSDTVQRGIGLLSRKNRSRKRPVRLSANIVISRLNIHQVPDIIKYFESLDWRVSVDLYRWSASHQQEIDEMKIEDGPELRRVLKIACSSRAVTTSAALINGFPDYLSHRSPKRCPYLSSRGLGTKLFINPDMSMSICMGDDFGNLREQTIESIFKSQVWREHLQLMRRCPGCWNLCYTPLGIVSRPRSFEDLRTIWSIFRKG